MLMRLALAPKVAEVEEDEVVGGAPGKRHPDIIEQQMDSLLHGAIDS